MERENTRPMGIDVMRDPPGVIRDALRMETASECLSEF
jgi:hypothetical protein